MTARSLALGLFGSLVLVGCSGDSEETPVIRPVRYMVVESTDAARQRTFSGVTQAGQESRLSFRVAGRVTEVPVKVGNRVTKGKTIARMDPADYSLELQNARASAAQARAQERNAKATYERTRALYENQNASRQDLDSDRTSYDSARAALNSANQQVRLLQRQLSYTHLTAPAAGTIATVDVEANENVTAGQLVATLLMGNQIEVNVPVPASVIRNIEQGDRVVVRCDALDEKEFPGVVTEVGVASVSGRTTFPVTVTLTEGEDQVRAGMAADVTFSFERQKGTPDYSLPVSAVGEDRQGRFVFVVKKKGDGNLGVVERRPVEVGKMTSQGIEILQGVKPGDLVVTAGVSRIFGGMEVRVPPKPGAGPDNTAGPPSETPEPTGEPPTAEIQ